MFFVAILVQHAPPRRMPTPRHARSVRSAHKFRVICVYACLCVRVLNVCVC